MPLAIASALSKTVANCSSGNQRSLAAVAASPRSPRSTWPAYRLPNFLIMLALLAARLRGRGLLAVLVKVAGREVLRSDELELGRALGAVRHRERAARVEATAGRRIQRARDFAADDQLVLGVVRRGRQGGREERLGVGMARVVAHLLAVADLDDLAEVHDRDP